MGWQTIVSSATPAPVELTPRDPSARYKLILEIQQELRRVGCYWGRMDGSWKYAIKTAMKEFTDRVNATLPLDQPDYIQLTLIQSQRDEVCGACPAGQSLAASGRCVGHPVHGATQNEVLPWKAKALFKPVPATVRHSRTVARPHGDRRPGPDIGRRATGRAVPCPGNRGLTSGDGDRRTRDRPTRRSRGGAVGDGCSEGGAPVEQQPARGS